MKKQNKESEIIIEETGSIPEGQLPEGVTPIRQQPQSRSVKEVLAEDAIMLKGMSFTMDEARKFFPIFAKLEEDLVACVEAIDREERKAKEAQQNAAADPE